MECQKEKNLQDCPCTYPSCSKKGFVVNVLGIICKEKDCQHCFSKEVEKTYDRSIKRFIEEQG